MFSQSEKITARPGVFRVAGEDPKFCIKWPKMSFLHSNAKLVVVFYIDVIQIKMNMAE